MKISRKSVLTLCALIFCASSTRCVAQNASAQDVSAPGVSAPIVSAPTASAPIVSAPIAKTKEPKRAFLLRETQSRARLQRLAKAALQAANKTGDVFRFSDANYIEKLAAFLPVDTTKNGAKNDIGEGASDELRPRFNNNLQNTSIHGQESKNVVLFYEGAPRKLDFRYNGWAVVALADGSVRSVTPDLAQKLRWHWKASDDALEQEGSVLDLSSPERTAITFINALNDGRFATARRCIYGVSENQITSQPLKGWDANRMMLDIKKFAPRQLGDLVNVAQYQIKIGKLAFVNGGMTAFLSEDGGWRIVAAPSGSLKKPTLTPVALTPVASTPTPETAPVPAAPDADAPAAEFDPAAFDPDADSSAEADADAERQLLGAAPQTQKSRQAGTLSLLAAALLDSKEFSVAAVINETAQKTDIIAAMNLKMLGLGAFQLAQDYDEVFAMSTNDFQEKMKPYLPSGEDLFRSPATGEPFAMNPYLAHSHLSNISEPARTVLFYDGIGEQLDFSYNGRAAVGFADGHVAFITPEQASGLIWNVPDFMPAPVPATNNAAPPNSG